MRTANWQTTLGMFVALTGIFFLTACSSGGSSGGSSSGVGSSSLQGNVASMSVVNNQPVENHQSVFASIMHFLQPVATASADGGVEGIAVGLGEMRTVTDRNGYFRFNGVAPGTHQLTFAKNGQVAQTAVAVGPNEDVTMQNIRMNGSRARAQSVSRMARSSAVQPGTPASQGPQNSHGSPGTPRS